MVELDELVARCIEAIDDGDAGFVDRVCGEHPELAERIRGCLRGLDGHGMLEKPSAPEHPDQVGPYRVLEEIGRGGMGTVYLAEQRQPVQRRVAIKVVKLGMDTREVLERFERERRTLALMTHANIATVLDAGVTTQGRPYFAMEYVPGMSITAYCDRHALSTEARLQLFLPVCEAVQHAHHKGVVHRDLKPSNLLVKVEDGVAVPKIIDFGVAKALHRDAGTLHTEHGALIGTIEYMSPEQAGHDRLDVDSRTDVYSLGVVLYELLAGVLPFDSARLRAAAGDAQNILLREEPPTPSTRISTLGARAEQVASHRRSDVSRLRKRLRGDLDWIVLKALEKDRARRYGTPIELAADIRRHLADEPVLAGPPSGWYRVRKFVRRHRAQVASAVVVLSTLLAGFFASLVFYFDARAATKDAQLAQGRAEANYTLAREAVEKMLTRVGSEQLVGVPQMEHVRRELLEEALRFYEAFLRDRQADPQLQLDVARAQLRVAGIYQMLNRHAEAEAAYVSVQERLSALIDGEHGLAARRDLASARNRYASLLWHTGRVEPAMAAARQSLREFEELASGSGNAEDAFGAARGHNQLGRLLVDSQPNVARQEFEHAVRIDEDLRGKIDRRRLERTLVDHLGDLGEILRAMGERDAAEKALVRAKEIVEALLRDDPGSADLRNLLGKACGRLGTFYGFIDTKAPARDNLEAASEIWTRLAREFPAIADYRVSLATSHNNLATVLLELADRDAARVHYRKAIEVQESLVEDFPGVPDHRTSLAGSLGNLGRSYLDLYLKGLRSESLDDAEPFIRRGVEILTTRCREQPDLVAERGMLAQQTGNLAMLLRLTQRVDAAEPFYRRAAEVLEELAGRYPEIPSYARSLAAALSDHGTALSELDRHDEARTCWQRAEAALRQSAGRDLESDDYTFLLRDLAMTRARGEALSKDHQRAALAVEAMRTEFDDQWLVHDLGTQIYLQCVHLLESAPLADQQRAGLRDLYLRRAEDSCARTLVLQEQMEQHMPQVAQVHLMRAGSLRQLASICSQRGDFAKARQALETAVEQAGVALEKRPIAAFHRRLRETQVALLEHLLQQGDSVAAAAHAEGMAARHPGDAEDLYAAARTLARCAPAATYGDRAVALLARAVAAGWRDVPALRADAAWAALRGGDGFERVIDAAARSDSDK